MFQALLCVNITQIVFPLSKVQYYQLKAQRAIFPKSQKENEYSRYQHLGKARSSAHINGVLAVVRRVQIDELTKAIDGLKDSWSDLYSNEEKVGHRVE